MSGNCYISYITSESTFSDWLLPTGIFSYPSGNDTNSYCLCLMHIIFTFRVIHLPAVDS